MAIQQSVELKKKHPLELKRVRKKEQVNVTHAPNSPFFSPTSNMQLLFFCCFFIDVTQNTAMKQAASFLKKQPPVEFITPLIVVAQVFGRQRRTLYFLCKKKKTPLSPLPNYYCYFFFLKVVKAPFLLLFRSLFLVIFLFSYVAFSSCKLSVFRRFFFFLENETPLALPLYVWLLTAFKYMVWE